MIYWVRRLLTVFLPTAVLVACGGGGSGQAALAELPAIEALIARAKTFELNTPYVAPPGDVLEHHTSGYAKTMCSAVFITGLDPEFAAEHVGYFTGPYEQRSKVGKPVVDRARREVRITTPGVATVVARHVGSQGCVTLPPGRDDVLFKPTRVASTLADATTVPWPMGDVLPSDARPRSWTWAS